MNRVVEDQLELGFDADQMSVKATAVAPSSAGAQVVCLSAHVARKAASLGSDSSASDSDWTLIERIADRVRLF